MIWPITRCVTRCYCKLLISPFTLRRLGSFSIRQSIAETSSPVTPSESNMVRALQIKSRLLPHLQSLLTRDAIHLVWFERLCRF